MPCRSRVIIQELTESEDLMSVMPISIISTPFPTANATRRPESSEPTKPVESLHAEDDHSGIEEREASDGNKPGVLRLLEDGHFKGVAELQQRIRFHEELSSKTDADAAAAFEAGAEDLLIDIRGEIKTIVRSLALDETPLDAAASDGGSTEPLASSSLVLTFEASVEEAIADATVDGTLDIESATADIQAAFDTMTASLTELYESTLTVDGDTVTATDSTLLDDALASLALVYEEAMAALLASVEESSELEDPTPAPGNGVAFDKFLAIYDSLRYGDSSTIDQTA